MLQRYMLGCQDYSPSRRAQCQLAYTLGSAVVPKEDGVLENCFSMLHVLGLQQHADPLLDSLQQQPVSARKLLTAMHCRVPSQNRVPTYIASRAGHVPPAQILGAAGSTPFMSALLRQHHLSAFAA